MPGLGRVVTLNRAIKKYLSEKGTSEQNLKKVGECISQLRLP